jgi:hypothetical protein
MKIENVGQSPPQAVAVGSDPGPLRRRRRFWLRAIWVLLACVLVLPALGLAGTAMAMVGAFADLAETGSADPSVLAGDISMALLSTAWGVAFAAPALLGLMGAVIRFFTLPKPPPASGTPDHAGHL